jgi:beta-lactamase class A
MFILGVGLAVISGTGISILSAKQKAEVFASDTTENSVEETEKAPNSRYVVPLYLRQSRELTELKSQLQNLAASSPELMPGIFLVDLDTGGYIDINAGVAFPAASTIKLPVLVAFFQAFDEGKVRLDETLTMEASQVAEGSGDLQYQKPGTKYTVLETITKMIVISDNTATNMIIDRLGGAEVLNQQFLKWGLRNTAIRNPLPDLGGTNTTSPHDLTNLVSQVEQGGLLSMKSRDRLFHIMEQTQNDSLIPKGLGRGAIIAHKTGNINSVLADAGAIDMPNGKRYLLSVLIKRPAEGYTPAANLIRDVSETVYKYFE